jgi:hypothetical protein
MLRYASEFGFTPASRTCVVKGSLVKANKFGDLLDQLTLDIWAGVRRSPSPMRSTSA